MNVHRSVFLSAILGNILEYYDFTVYAVFAITIGKTPLAAGFVRALPLLSSGDCHQGPERRPAPPPGAAERPGPGRPGARQRRAAHP